MYAGAISLKFRVWNSWNVLFSEAFVTIRNTTIIMHLFIHVVFLMSLGRSSDKPTTTKNEKWIEN